MKYEQIIARIALTGPQMRLIKQMENGWVLYWSNEVSDRRCWIKGPEDKEFSVPVPMVNKLEELGIIKQDNEVPLGTFHFVK